MNSSNFYCQKLFGEEDFSIEKWNETYQMCLSLGITGIQKSKLLHPESFPCKNQCEKCLNVVLDTKSKNKAKFGW